MKFADVDGEHCSIIRSNDSNDPLTWISRLLACDQAEISSALTSRVVAARNEVIQTRQNIIRANHGRDALSKVSQRKKLNFIQKKEKNNDKNYSNLKIS